MRTPIPNCIAVYSPVPYAYEAATADIGDYNMIDPYYKEDESSPLIKGARGI